MMSLAFSTSSRYEASCTFHRSYPRRGRLKSKGVIGSAEVNRRRYIDWMRGVAVLCMIEHHTFDAFLDPSLHGSAWDRTFRFVGGVAAPGFLFLAGLSLALALERRGG